MKNRPKNTLRTWIEVDKKVIFRNIDKFRKIIKPNVKLMAIVKSNAYGHGLADFANTVKNRVDWFGVDSIAEGLKLREIGLKKPVLVLGHTLPSRIKEAAKNNISLTVSSIDALKTITKIKRKPKVHIKVDTGMHRQGFYFSDLPQVVRTLKEFKIIPEGLYSHFAAAKNKLNESYTLKQMADFKKADDLFKKCGKNYLRHIAASGAAMLYPNAHFDMVRIGMGLYKNALTWKSIIGEVKKIPAGAFIGYDLTEKTKKPVKIAVVPIGYWHGFDRGFSSCGQVLIKNRKCKVLGRVSMDMIIINVSNIPNINAGDEIIILGKSEKEKITAEEMAKKIGTIDYEIITRINPLIKRFYI